MNTRFDRDKSSTPRGISNEEFSAVFSDWWGNVFATIYSRTGNRELAQDLASVTFLNAFKGRHTFYGELNDDTTGSWLHGILRHTMASHFRSLRQRHESTLVDSLEACPDIADPEDHLNRVELRQATVDLLLQVKSSDRAAIFLRYFEGKTPDDTAKMLGVPSGTGRSRVSRALTNLRVTNDDPRQD